MPQSIDIPQRQEPLAHFSNGSSMESDPHSINMDNVCHVIPKRYSNVFKAMCQKFGNILSYVAFFVLTFLCVVPFLWAAV